ncbi:MAG: LysM peptidoglycan-binding domain-containing protein [Puniceicoccales bacterium]|jgi:LysM repeat protein|nr:LysM peptidoglycan-binding domain-containing protein [Puniceicoccales bacterium]
MNRKLFLNVCAASGLLLLTGCSSFQDGKVGDRPANNVAYSVPESVARSGVEVRMKPSRPSWTEDVFCAKCGCAKCHCGLEANKCAGGDGEICARKAGASQSGGKSYTVKKGDTIYGIARRMGLCPQNIMELNGLDRSSKLYVGQTIKLPGKNQGAPSGEFKGPLKRENDGKKDTIKYVVAQGDSLSRIARMHSMKVAELKELNNLSDDFIRVGQELDVYKSKNPITKRGAAIDAKKYALDGDGLYTIQAGDSLDKVARNFGISSRSLGEVNGIDDPLKLQIGKKLIIPSKSAAPSPAVSSPVVPVQGRGKSIPAQGGNSGEARNRGDSDDFFETFDNIKVFEIEN